MRSLLSSQPVTEPAVVFTLDSSTPVAQSVTPMGSALNNLVVSYASAVGERVASTYEALSLRKVINYWVSARIYPRCLSHNNSFLSVYSPNKFSYAEHMVYFSHS